SSELVTTIAFPGVNDFRVADADRRQDAALPASRRGQGDAGRVSHRDPGADNDPAAEAEHPAAMPCPPDKSLRGEKVPLPRSRCEAQSRSAMRYEEPAARGCSSD